MRLANILIILALLMPLAFSTSDMVGDEQFEGKAIDIATPAPGHATEALSERVFVGSIKSDKYHYPSCSAAKKIKPDNEIWFSSSEDARAHGYVPCGLCHPP